MKKAILLAVLALISAAAIAQPGKKAKKDTVKADSTETYRFTKDQASFLYQALEDEKKFIALSDDVSARKANTFYIPRADSLQRILGKQAQFYINRKKAIAKSDSLRADSLKKATTKLKPAESH